MSCELKQYLMIGSVLRPQGIRGEVKLRPYAADVELFRKWKTLFLEDHGAYTPVKAKVTRIHDGFVYAVLGDCASADDAEAFRGRDLFIDRDHAAPRQEGAVLIADLMGCEALDEEGRSLGVLEDVLQYGTVDTWVFKTPLGTMMAPALLSVFPRVEPAERKIFVCAEKLREVAVYDD